MSASRRVKRPPAPSPTTSAAPSAAVSSPSTPPTAGTRGRPTPSRSRRTREEDGGTQMWAVGRADLVSSRRSTERNAVYVTTGNNYSGPATDRSDAFMAFDMRSGKILWSRQMTASDDWNTVLPPDRSDQLHQHRTPRTSTSPRRRSSCRWPTAGARSWPVRSRGWCTRSIPIAGASSSGRSASARAASTAACSGARRPTDPMSTSRCPTWRRFPVPNSQATIPDPEAGGGMFAMSLDSGQARVAHSGAARVQARATDAARRSRPR